MAINNSKKVKIGLPSRGRTVPSKYMVVFNRLKWDDLWDEFSTARRQDGTLKYLTIWSFIREKAPQDKMQQSVMYWACGPKPVILDKARRKRVPVPWLGDWVIMRSEMFHADDKRIERLKQVIIERQDALEAGRGVALVAMELVHRYMRYSDQIDQVFSGMPVLPGAKIEDNMKRAHALFDLMRRAEAGVYRGLNQFLECHGVGKDDLSVLAQMAMVSMAVKVKEVSGTLDPVNKAMENPTMRSFVQMFAAKSQTLGLELPGNKTVDMKVEKDDEGSSNGKNKGKHVQ